MATLNEQSTQPRAPCTPRPSGTSAGRCARYGDRRRRVMLVPLSPSVDLSPGHVPFKTNYRLQLASCS